MEGWTFIFVLDLFVVSVSDSVFIVVILLFFAFKSYFLFVDGFVCQDMQQHLASHTDLGARIWCRPFLPSQPFIRAIAMVRARKMMSVWLTVSHTVLYICLVDGFIYEWELVEVLVCISVCVFEYEDVVGFLEFLI